MTPGRRRAPNEWDRFWQGDDGAMRESAECAANGEALKSAWRSFFSAALADRVTPRIVDIACGAGAIYDAAADQLSDADFVGFDLSLAALHAARRSAPGALFVAADAAFPALRPASADILVSQFGVEYAGVGAVAGASTFLAPGGVVCLHLHHRDSAIFEECTQNAMAAKSIFDIGVIDAARAAFEATAPERNATRAPTQLAVNLQTAVAALQKNINAFGADAAGGALAHLYNGLAAMFQRRAAFATKDAISWCDTFRIETEEYIKRMRAMTEAAFDADALAQVQRAWRDDGLDLDDRLCGALRDGEAILGWRLAARRR